MPLSSILLALTVVIVWGLSFSAIKFGVDEMPPLFLTAFRFALAALPAVFFVPRPSAWRYLAGFGFILGVVKFSVMFLAIKAGLPTGLSSILIQTQVFFTIAFAALMFRERPTRLQLTGTALALAGVVIITASRATGAPMATLFLTLFAAVCWGLANLIAKAAGKADMLAFIIWSSLIPPIPLLALSLVFEGPAAIRSGVTEASWLAWGALLYMAYGATLFGFSAWNHLLSRYSTAAVAPFGLLVPIVGMVVGAFVLGEAMPPVIIGGAALILTGLAVTLFGAQAIAALRRR